MPADLSEDAEEKLPWCKIAVWSSTNMELTLDILQSCFLLVALDLAVTRSKLADGQIL